MSFNSVDQVTGDTSQLAGNILTAIYADSPIGAIVPYGGDTAPTGYLLCDGSAVSRTTYADLFAVIGTKYGSGDGSTTFNLPDGEAGAELYPAADVGSGIAGSVYIIKAVKTALPTDFQTALDEKQDIVDNALQTTSKEIVGAINEINSDLTVLNTAIANCEKWVYLTAITTTGGTYSVDFTQYKAVRIISIYSDKIDSLEIYTNLLTSTALQHRMRSSANDNIGAFNITNSAIKEAGNGAKLYVYVTE